LASVNGGTIIDGATNPDYHWFNFAERLAEIGKKLPFQSEFMSAAEGSNNETNISGSSDPGTAGGHSDTASRRMISNIGCEDMAGAYWQWGQDTSADDHSGSSWAVSDTASDGTTYDGANSIGKGQYYEAPDRVILGGYWGLSSICGVRTAAIHRYPLSQDSSDSARGVAESASNRL